MILYDNMPNTNNTIKTVVIGAGVTLVIIGAAIYSQLDNWFTPEPTGPGSGDEIVYEEPTGPGSGDEIDLSERTGPGSGDEVTLDPTGPGSGDEYSVIGSCNSIDFGSICTDYVGSYWATIKDSIRNCSDVGTWSDNPCPTNYQGGCNTSAGTNQENIIWYYNYGGDPFDAELTGYAEQGCNVNPYGTWITGS